MELPAKFEEEVLWCRNRLREKLESQSLSQKQTKDALSAMAVLENPKAPLPKKRQAMRATCGDYRAKMEKEENAFRLDARVSKTALPPGKSQFVKHSAYRSRGVAAMSNSFGALSVRKNEDLSTSSSGQKGDCAKPKDPAFRFNFGQESSSPAIVVETKEASMITKKFKFKPSNNDFKFNFSQ